NWHVVEGNPVGAVAVFDNHVSAAGFGQENAGRIVPFADDWLVAHSEHGRSSVEFGPDGPPQGNWDFAVVRLKEEVGAQAIGPDPQAKGADKRDHYKLDGSPYQFEEAEPVFILGHPSGQPVRLSLACPSGIKPTRNLNRVRYPVNTGGGSS